MQNCHRSRIPLGGFMNVVVITGPESAGKSVLAKALHQRLGGLLCEEYVRRFIDEHQRDPVYTDIARIAEGQLQDEDAARARQPQWLWLDTHLLSNMLWSQVLFGPAPAWLEPALLSRRYDLHLLLSPDGVPWVADGQRCQPDATDRRAFFEACRAWLEEHKQAYTVLEGSWEQRLHEAQAALAQHFGRQAQP
jgi:NadR type nicotinamide-nucleotide adenylyltransferase